MMSRRWLPLTVAIGGVSLLSFFAYADLGTPSGLVIPYSGRVELSGEGVDGPLTVRFSVFNQAAGGAACFTSSDLTTSAHNGAFSLEIGPIPEVCVLGREMWLGASVIDGATEVVLGGRQRVVPAIAASTSGIGSFFTAASAHIAEALDVDGDVHVGAGLRMSSARVAGSNEVGNLHIDANDSALGTGSDGRLYLNWYSGNGVVFGNGAGGQVAALASSGTLTANGDVSALGNSRENCTWTAYGCGDQVCPDQKFVAGINIGENEACYGGGDFDFSSYRLLCCEL